MSFETNAEYESRRFPQNSDIERPDSSFTPENRQINRDTYYAQHNFNQPLFNSEDIAGFGLAAVMTLGPLAAFAAGLGA